MTETAIEAAANSCVNCKFEKTCGYSPWPMFKERTESSYRPCPLGLMSARGNKQPRPFFQPKGFEFTPDEEMKLEAEHRAARPEAEWHYIVKLPFGDFDRVNRMKYDAAIALGWSSQCLQLASTAWVLLEDLTVIDR